MPPKFKKKLIKLGPNPYVLYKILAQGQFGVIYLAQSTGRKILPGSKGQKEKIPDIVCVKEYFYSRFQDQDGNNNSEDYWKREVSNTELQAKFPRAQLQVIDYGKNVDATHNEYYIVITFVEGKTIKDWFVETYGKHPQLSEDEIGHITREILIPIAQHLEYCHMNGLVHRDLSIENVLIKQPKRKAYIPVIIDWGAGKRMDPKQIMHPKKPYFESNRTSSTAFMNRGTPPEIIMGLDPIAASDIYMFGHLMYFVFSGGKTCRTPAVKEDYILHPRQENPSLPVEYNQLVEKCTQYEPADRIDSMGSILHILEKMLQKVAPAQITGFLKPRQYPVHPSGKVAPNPNYVPVKMPVPSPIGVSKPNNHERLAINTPQPAAMHTPSNLPTVNPIDVSRPANPERLSPSTHQPISINYPVNPSSLGISNSPNQPINQPASNQPNPAIMNSQGFTPFPQVAPLFPSTPTEFKIDERTQQFASAFLKYFEDPSWEQQRQDSVQIYYTFFQGLVKALKEHSPLIINQKIDSNIYFIGPTLGSLNDLRIILNYFQLVLRKVPNTIIIFTGSYFRPSTFYLEAFCFIMAFKCLYPQNVVILRGPTEEKGYLETCGIISDLKKRFDKHAPFIIDQLCEIISNLDLMHIGEIGNGIKVMSTSGGLPFVIQNTVVENLQTIEPRLNARQAVRSDLDLNTQSILWGRPNELADNIKTDSHGSVYYSWSLLQNFFRVNNVRYMVIGDASVANGHRTIWNVISAINSCTILATVDRRDAKILRMNMNGMADLLVRDLQFYLSRDYGITSGFSP